MTITATAVRATTSTGPQGTRTSGAMTPAPATIPMETAGARDTAVRGGSPAVAVMSRPGTNKSAETTRICGMRETHTNDHIIR